MRSHALLLTACYLLTQPSLAFPQPFIEHLEPPVIQRGTLSRLAAIGTDVQNPVGLWTSLPPTLIRTKAIVDSGTENTKIRSNVDVEVSPLAPLGLYGLRLATPSGLSNVHLFLIDELPVTARDTLLPENGVQAVTLPACITAPCRPATVDRYSIPVQAGQRVTFEVIGNRLGKDYDPLVQIRNAMGQIVAQCDNSIGLFFDMRFSHTFPTAGTYTVEVRDARFEGDSNWYYVLRMGDFPEARMAVPSAVQPGATSVLKFPQTANWEFPLTLPRDRPFGTTFQEVRNLQHGLGTWIPLTVTDLTSQSEVEPNDTRETASAVTIPASLNGVLQQPRDSDWFALELTQGQKLNFQGFAKLIGSAADLELVLFDPDGREVRRTDDVDQTEANFTFQAGKAGVHCLQVRDVARDGGPEFAYRIDVRPSKPDFTIAAEFSDITLPQGTYQPLPLKVTRQDFAGEIRLDLRGAPPGVTLEPTVIPANTNEFVAKLIASPQTPVEVANLQIIGTATIAGQTVIETTATTKPLVDRQLRNVDLILYALREDQQQLPPSLTNQIALQVTPASPFNVELQELEVQLTRFQNADFPILTSRNPGFQSPILFQVTGGQIGKEAEERNQVYARFTPATEQQTQAKGTFYNRILTNLNRHRVDLTAVSEHNGRSIYLKRTFLLNIRSAFQPTCEPAQMICEPGGRVRFKILSNRVSTYRGPMTLTFTPLSNFKLPETVELPADQAAVDVEFQVDPQINPGRYDVRILATGFVNQYEESVNLPNLQIEVKKPEVKKP